jgi:hypothetical protein
LLKDDSAIDPNHGKTVSTDESDAADSDRTDESESLGIVQDKVSGKATKNQKFVLERMVLGGNPEMPTN